ASATGSCLLAAGLLDRIHAQRDLLLPTQNGTGVLTDHEHTVVAVGFEQSAGQDLADHGLPLALRQIGPDAPDAQALMVGRPRSVVVVAAQHLDDRAGAEALPACPARPDAGPRR